MNERYYLLASWYLQAGQEEEFTRIWKEELAPVFLGFDPTSHGTLIQSMEDPRQFYSFGPWDSRDRMMAARSDPRAREIIANLIALCDDAKPGPFRVVLEIKDKGQG